MRVFTEKTLTDYGHAHPRVREELKVWVAIVGAARWANFNELRADLSATDYIGNDRYVFNLKGNHYRLIAMIFFGAQRLYVRGIFTHAEYTKNQKKLRDL